jgi:hypothetical protein
MLRIRSLSESKDMIKSCRTGTLIPAVEGSKERVEWD